MNLETHFACGWVLGNLWPGAARRERFLAVAAALISDVDGLSYLAGESAFSNWHHTVGHNVFVTVPLVVGAALLARKGRTFSTVVMVLLAFLSHMVGDYFLSGWELWPLWPASRWEVMFRPRMGLDHPANVVLSYASFAMMAASLWMWGRSPLELFWPSRDALLARAVRPCGLRCDECGEKLRLNHAVIGRGSRIVCRKCAARAKADRAEGRKQAAEISGSAR